MPRNLFELSFRNQAAVIANVMRFEDNALAEIRALVVEYGEKARALTQSFAPVRTGWMRDHVRTRYGPLGYSWETGWDANDFIGQGLSFYPWFVEFGTRFMGAQPSLTPAYNIVAPQFHAALSAKLAALAARGGRR